MADAFISYRRRPSAALAHLLQEKLEAEYRFDIYLDTTRQDSAKVQFPDRLLNAIDASKVFICLLADDTLESAWVLKEIQRAHLQQKPCIPVFQETYKPTAIENDSVDYLLSFDGVHVLDQRGLYMDEFVIQIAGIIKKTVSQRRWKKRAFAILSGALLILIVSAALFILNSRATVSSGFTPEPTASVSPVFTNTPRPPTHTPRPTSTLPAVTSRDYVFDLQNSSLWHLNNLQPVSVANAYRVTGDDPYIEMNNEVNLGLCWGDYSYIYLQLNAPRSRRLQIYYVKENDKYEYYDEARTFFLGVSQGELQTIAFRTSSTPIIKETDHLERIRLDLGDSVTTDFIYLFDFRLIDKDAGTTSTCDLPTATATP